MTKSRVLLAEDHTIVRKGRGSALDGKVGIEVVGEANDGKQAGQKRAKKRRGVQDTLARRDGLCLNR